MASVVLENLGKVYAGEKGRSVSAVENVSLEIRDREFMVFVGPSGCGKSTMLRMIAGLEDISSGTIKIDGKKVNDVPPKDRDIAMVFQNYALYPHMTVRRNIAFGLELRRMPRSEIDQRVKEAAQILNLTDDMLDRKPKALSGGQRQRVALGRAIVRKPKVFLFDEPLSNLDAKMRVQMRAEITKLHRQLNITMIYVTHDQVEAMTMGDRICVLKDGHLQQVDRPLEIYNRPANLFVAGFIGSPPMNFLAGKVIEKGNLLCFEREKSLSGQELFRLNEAQAAALKSWPGKRVIMGIRSEDLEPIKSTDTENILTATVELAEPMGAETHFYLNSAEERIVARVRGQVEAEPATKIQFTLHPTKCRYFEAADPEPFRKANGEIDIDRWHAACGLIV
jgi:multiple sugar transport system ATP-binding protein